MSYSFPAQNLTRAQKRKEYGSEEKFGEAVLESLNNFRTFSSFKTEEWKIHENYNLLEGKFNREDYQGTFDFFGEVLSDYKMPAELDHYDLMSPKYELLKGEELKRPFNHKVISTNADSVSRVQEKKNNEIKERMDYDLQQALQAAGLLEAPQEQLAQMAPREYPEIQRHYDLEYRDKMEVAAASSLEYLKAQLHLDWVFNEGWGHYLKSARELYWVGDIEGEPRIRNVDPRFCAYELSSGVENIERCTWFIEWRYLTAADIHEEYHSAIKKEDVEKIETLKGNVSRSHDEPYMATYFSGEYVTGSENSFRIGNETLLKVIRVEWMGLRKIGFVTYLDEDGQIQKKTVDETFKKTEFPYQVISVEWEWINEPWEATRIGEDIYVNIRPVPNADFSLDNLGRRKLQYVGTTGKYSIVEKMKQWNLLYNVIMMRMKQEIVTSIGQVGVFDVSQIPRSEGFDMDKWLYYLNVFKIGFINSQEEGKRGKPSGFNQWKSMNMAHTEMIQQWMSMANFIEKKIADITGITPQREGQVAASETVGGVERSVQSSSYITEYLFYTHAETKRRVLERLLDRAKFSWRDGKKAFYAVEGDLTRRILDIEPGGFAHENFGIFVQDKSHDHEAQQLLRQAAVGEIQAGNADLRNILAVIKSDNLTQMETKLDTLYAERDEKAQAAKQAETEQLMAIEQSKQQAEMQKDQFKEQNANARNQADNMTKLEIANLQFATKTNDANRNGVLDTVEAQLKQKELELQERRENRELDLKEKELEQEERLTQEELDIKRIIANNSKSMRSVRG